MINQERLHELLDYSKETGLFRWRESRGSVVEGSIAGCIRNDGYLMIMIDRVLHRSHRLAWLYVMGEFPGDEIDHINHVRADNRFDNLREATNTDNQRNRSINKNNKSGFNGVFWSKAAGKWWARIQVNRKLVNLGDFTNKEDAISARKEANIKYGFHDNHGK